MGAHPIFSTLSRRGLNPIKLAYSPSPPGNGRGQYVSSPGNRAYCYAELAVFPCEPERKLLVVLGRELELELKLFCRRELDKESN